MNLGPLEIGGILALFVLLFGAKKLPDLGSSVGKSIRNFKSGINEGREEDSDDPSASTPGAVASGDAPTAKSSRDTV